MTDLGKLEYTVEIETEEAATGLENVSRETDETIEMFERLQTEATQTTQALQAQATQSNRSAAAFQTLQSGVNSIKWQALGAGLTQLANIIGGGSDSLIGRVGGLASQMAGVGGVLGPVGAAVGGLAGGLIGLAREMLTVEDRTNDLSEAQETLTSRVRGANTAFERQQIVMAGVAEESARILNQVFNADPVTRRTIAQAELNDIMREANTIAGQGGIIAALSATERARLVELTEREVELSRTIAEADEEIQRNAPREEPASRTSGRSRAPDAEREAAELRRLAEDTDRFERETFDAFMADRRRQWDEEAQRRLEDFAKVQEVEREENERRQATETRLREIADERSQLEFARMEPAEQLDALHARELDILTEIARISADGITTDEERIRIGELQNDLYTTQAEQVDLIRQRSEAIVQNFQEAGSEIGGVFADAYSQAINGQKSFEKAFQEGFKKLLANKGTELIIDGVAALATGVGNLIFNPPAAATKFAEGGIKLGLGAALGGISAAIPSTSPPAGASKPDSPSGKSNGGAEGGGAVTYVVNVNNALTYGSQAELGRSIEAARQVGVRRFGE